MSKEPILLLGAGGHAKVCIDVIEQSRCFTIAGLVGTAEQVGSQMLGYPVLGVDTQLPVLRKKYTNALVSIGQIKSPALRMRLFMLLEENNFGLPSVISPLSYVSPHATIGAGTIVMHGVIVSAGVVVGRNCILNSRALIEHDTIIGDHCHISTAATLNGGVRVDGETFIGSGTVIRESIHIGARCVIGMGQHITTDCHEDTKVKIAKEQS